MISVHKKNSRRGFSIVEVILAVALFGLITVGLMGSLLFGQESTLITGQRSQAIALADGALEAVRNIQDQSFAKINSLPDGTYYLDKSQGIWELNASVPETIQIFNREVFLETIDGRTKEVTARVSWQQNNKRTGLVELVARFTNWAVRTFIESGDVEFAAGGHNSVVVTDQGDGAVELMAQGQWSSPSAHLNIDLPGNSDAVDMVIADNTLWVARVDQILYEYTLADISGGSLVEVAQYPINRTPTGLDVVGDTAYVSSSNNGTELVIIDLSGVNPNIFVDAPGDEDATDVALVGDKIALTRVSSVNPDILVYDSSGVLVGTVEVGDDANAVVGDSEYAYVATGRSLELFIVNVNDCSGGVSGLECSFNAYNPISGGNIDATAIFLAGDQLFMGRDNNQIHGFTVVNGSVTGEFLDYNNRSDRVQDIYADVANDLVYFVTDDANNRELRILDISNPASPIDYEIDLAGGSDANAVLKYGAHLYIASDNNSNELMILSGGGLGWNEPELVGQYNAGASANAVFVEGGYAYVGTDSEFLVLDVADPTTPLLEDSINLGFEVYDVYVSSGYAFLATSNNAQELIAIDVSDPFDISQVGSYDANSAADGYAVWVSGTTVYLGTDRNNGGNDPEFYILGVVTGPATTFSLLGQYDVTQDVNDIVVDGTDAFLATGNNSAELMILDVGNPASLVLRDTYDRSGNQDAFGVAYESDRLLLVTNDAGGQDVLWFDVSDRNVISLLAGLETGHDHRSVFLQGERAVAVGAENGQQVLIFDMSSADAGTVSELVDYDAGDDCFGVFWEGDYIYVSCHSGSQEFQIIGPSTQSTGYSDVGWYTSRSFDSDAANTIWQDVSWTVGGTGSVEVQLRTAPDSGGTPGIWSRWFGPSGVNTYYTSASGGNNIYSEHQDSVDDQWIQYRVRLQGDTATTPVFESITIEY